MKRGLLIGILAIGLVLGSLGCQAEASPQQVVEAYLTALSEGRATDALKFSQASPVDPRFVDDGFFASARALGAIAGISVHTDSIGQVFADYTVNGQPNTNGVAVEQDDVGHWFVKDPLVVVDTSWASAWMGITLNGIPIDADDTPEVDLLPGGYKFGTTNPRLTIEESVLLARPGYRYFSTEDGHDFTTDWIGLTADTKTKAASFMTTALTSCLAEHSLTTSCGISVGGSLSLERSSGKGTVPVSDVVPASVTWSTTWSGVRPESVVPGWTRVGGEGSRLAVALDSYGSAQVEARTKDGRAVRGGCDFTGVRVDISDPDHLTLVVDTTAG